MPINNPPEEQYREQLRFHAEALMGEIDELIEKLDKKLGVDNYVIGADGGITIKLSEWEINPDKEAEVNKIEGRLKSIYKEIKEIGERIGFDVIRKTSREIIH